MPDDVQQQMIKAQERMRQEMPEQMSRASIQPAGMLSRAMVGLRRGIPPLAITSPLSGNISYFPEAMQGMSQDDVESTLAHELTHTRQYQEQFEGKPWYQKALAGLSTFGPQSLQYGQRPEELEAFQTESDRAVRLGKAPSPMPTFETEGWRMTGDISLPSRRR